MSRYLPPQHGAWAFLALPLALGAVLAPASPLLLVLTVAWVAAYPLSYAALGLARARRKQRFVRPLVVWLAVVYLGVFPTAVAFTTWAYALARTPAGKLGATTYVVPAVTVAMSWLALAEVPAPMVFAGGILCLAGVSITRRRPKS